MTSNLFRDYVSRLHEKSEAETYAYARSQFKGSDEEFVELARQYAALAPDRKGTFLASHGISVQDSSLSLAVSPEMGEFLYTMTLAKGASSVLELGSSNGVSSLYFAEALRVRGDGMVIATELETTKCAALRSNVAAVGLTDFVDLRQGDVFETIKQIRGPFDIVFIDIWASGYLDIFKAIEPLLVPGTIILADNMFTAPQEVRPFKEYLHSMPRIQSSTLAFESGVEFAVIL
jgi:predicted O-methyltransferase YrrM